MTNFTDHQITVLGYIQNLRFRVHSCSVTDLIYSDRANHNFLINAPLELNKWFDSLDKAAQARELDNFNYSLGTALHWTS